MIQTWHGNELHPVREYDSREYEYFKKHPFSCDDGFTSLSVLINHCHNIIKSKYCHDNTTTLIKNTNDEYIYPNIIVYMNQKIYDHFLESVNQWNYKELFTVNIDETMHDDIVVISTLDEKFIESIKIIGL